MQIIQQGTFFKAARITGPRHNFLALEFIDSTNAREIGIEILGRSISKPNLSKSEVLESVLTALAKVNARLGENLTVSRLQYVAEDTPDIEAYAILTEKIAEHVFHRRKEK